MTSEDNLKTFDADKAEAFSEKKVIYRGINQIIEIIQNHSHPSSA